MQPAGGKLWDKRRDRKKVTPLLLPLYTGHMKKAKSQVLSTLNNLPGLTVGGLSLCILATAAAADTPFSKFGGKEENNLCRARGEAARKRLAKDASSCVLKR